MVLVWLGIRDAINRVSTVITLLILENGLGACKGAYVRCYARCVLTLLILENGLGVDE